MNQLISKILAPTKDLIYKGELRTLRNMSWMPQRIKQQVLHGLSLTHPEKNFLLTWFQVTTDPYQHFWEYYQWLNLEYSVYLDEYVRCYDVNYNLTTFGQELHDDTAAMVTQ